MSATAGAGWAVQTAIFSLLSADTTLAGLSLTEDTSTVRVYDDVPDGAKYPHVIIGDLTEVGDHTFGGATTGLGWKDDFKIHVLSRYQGKKEAMGILGRIVELLNYQPLTVSGFTSVTAKHERTRSLKQDIDKIETRNVVGEFCIRVRQ